MFVERVLISVPKPISISLTVPRLVRLLEPATHDPYLRTLKGCAELSTRVLFRNLAGQAEDAGLLHPCPG